MTSSSGVFGLQNYASVCYFNSLVQMLCSSKKLIESCATSNGKSAADQICKTFFANVKDGKYPANVSDILSVVSKMLPKYTVGQQQDAHEGFITLVDNVVAMKSEMLMMYESTLHCVDCQFVSQPKYEEYTCLQINATDVSDTKCTDIVDYMRGYITKPDSDYKCGNCKKNGTVYKKTILYSVSDIIVFSFNKYNIKFAMNCPKSFKLQSADTKKDLEYKLVGTVEHSGNKDSGHYVATGMRNDGAYLFNDSSTTKLQAISCSTNTYMCMYTCEKNK